MTLFCVILFTEFSVVWDSGCPCAAAILSGEESQRSEAEDSAIIERLAPGGNCGTASPSGNEVAVLESQAEKVYFTT